ACDNETCSNYKVPIFEAMNRTAAAYQPPDSEPIFTRSHSSETLEAAQTGEREPSTWSEVDLEAVLSGELDELPPVLMKRMDGVPLLYRGKVHAIIGEPESGKGWFSCAAAADALARGEHVIYVDFEDTAKGVVSRMRALGVSPEVLIDRFHYFG